MSVAIERLDPRAPGVADRLAALMREAYAVEAEWLGARDFPPARTSAADVVRTGGEVLVASRGGEWLGALGIEALPDGARLVGSLVVAPAHHRRGVGRALVAHAVALHGDGPLVVSTGAANVAALALYRAFGFVEAARRHVGEEPIEVVELRRPPGRAGLRAD